MGILLNLEKNELFPLGERRLYSAEASVASFASVPSAARALRRHLPQRPCSNGLCQSAHSPQGASLFYEIDDFGINCGWVVQHVIILVLEILVEEREHERIHGHGISTARIGR